MKPEVSRQPSHFYKEKSQVFIHNYRKMMIKNWAMDGKEYSNIPFASGRKWKKYKTVNINALEFSSENSKPRWLTWPKINCPNSSNPLLFFFHVLLGCLSRHLSQAVLQMISSWFRFDFPDFSSFFQWPWSIHNPIPRSKRPASHLSSSMYDCNQK